MISRAEAPALEIRPVGIFDTPVLAALHAFCFTEAWDRHWDMRSFADTLAMPGVAGRLAAIGEDPIGFAIGRTAADEAELLLIGMRPDSRRAGHGRILLKHMLDAFAAAGAAQVFLEVAAPNRAAMEFYRMEGFRKVGERPGYYRAAVAASVLARPLGANFPIHSE